MSEYGLILGAKLRRIRGQQGMSLRDVEVKSSGRWKAVVVGAYERSDRSLTLEKLVHLASFYRVPVTDLLPDTHPARRRQPATKIALNLQRLAELPGEQAGPLARFVASIQSLRGDYNGQVLTIRSSDLRTMAILYDVTLSQLTDQLIEWGVLAHDGQHPAGPARRSAAACDRFPC